MLTMQLLQYLNAIEQGHLRVWEQYANPEPEPWKKINDVLPSLDIDVLFWNSYHKRFEKAGFRSRHEDTASDEAFRSLLKRHNFSHWQRISRPLE